MEDDDIYLNKKLVEYQFSNGRQSKRSAKEYYEDLTRLANEMKEDDDE